MRDPIGGSNRHGRALALWALILVTVVACASTPVPTQTFPPIPDETPTLTTAPQALATPESRPTANPDLQIDGMATVVRDVDQIADPEHPNHHKDNRRFAPLEAGTRVYLVNRMTRKKMNWWQVYAGSDANGQLGWIPQLSKGELQLEPHQPDCPTEFPLTPESFADLRMGEALTCFGNTELTLTGDVSCDRSIAEYVISGVSFLDDDRSCHLGANALHLYGNQIFELLEAPPVDSISGRYLVRGHFDDPEAQNCYSIEFGTPFSTAPGASPEPGAVMVCREMFVVSNVISQT